MTRDLTDEEKDILDILGEAASRAAQLPEVHPSDLNQFAHHTTVLQNIVLSRPSFESFKMEW